MPSDEGKVKRVVEEIVDQESLAYTPSPIYNNELRPIGFHTPFQFRLFLFSTDDTLPHIRMKLSLQIYLFHHS